MANMIKKAAFIGSGLIGTGLAVNAATHGIDVIVQTRRQIDLCRTRIQEALDFLEEKESITSKEKEEALGRIRFTTDIAEAVVDADIIQESVPDKMDIKQSMIAQIEELAKQDAIIATSTSSLSITKIFENAKHPERCMGGHPYLPAYLLPLVEITKGEKTDDKYVTIAKEFYSAIGKEPVVLNKESIGFIANRLQSAIHREIVDIVMNGICSVEDVDKALVYSVGIRWGVIGQAMVMHLGAAPEGLSGFCEKYGTKNGVPNGRLSALASWNAYPENWDKVLGKGLEEAIKNRDPRTGNDIESISKWRDNMLAEMLKLHNKF